MQATLKNSLGDALYTVDDGIVEIEIMQPKRDGSMAKRRITLFLDTDNPEILRINSGYPVALTPISPTAIALRLVRTRPI